jgi:cell wall-associated NlpC family hydrolase
MLKRSGIIFSLGLALIISLCVPPYCQGEPGKKTHSSENAIQATPPPMKITPRPDGKFLLEPLTAPPKGLIIPVSRPTQKGESSGHIPPISQNMVTPLDISQLVLSKVRHARYSWGASLENGSSTDCSGFTRYIYRRCNIDLPRTSAEQAEVGQEVTRRMDFSKLEAGDLLFFRQGGRSVGHAGIYLGEGKMIHASRSGGGVEVAELDQGYFINNFVVAKRVFEKQYKWPVHPGLSPAARTRNLDSPVATLPSAFRLRLIVGPLDPLHLNQTLVLPRQGQIIVKLHPKPGFRAAAECF